MDERNNDKKNQGSRLSGAFIDSPRGKTKSIRAKSGEDYKEELRQSAQFGSANANPYSFSVQDQNNLMNEQIVYLYKEFATQILNHFEMWHKAKEEMAEQEAQEEKGLDSEEALKRALDTRLKEEEKMRELAKMLAQLKALQEELDQIRKNIDALSRELTYIKDQIKTFATKHYANMAADFSNKIQYASFDLSKAGVNETISISNKEVAEHLAKVMPEILINNKVYAKDIPQLEKEQVDLYMKARINDELATVIVNEKEREGLLNKIVETSGYQQAKEEFAAQILEVGRKKESYHVMCEKVDQARNIETKVEEEEEKAEVAQEKIKDFCKENDIKLEERGDKEEFKADNKEIKDITHLDHAEESRKKLENVLDDLENLSFEDPTDQQDNQSKFRP